MAPREPLLTAAFLERLRAARSQLLRRPRPGERRGRGVGPAPELETSRPYEPGDDARAIDWRVFARLERLWVKVHLLDDEGQVGVLVDTSGSMARPRAKALAAARYAAALCWLVLSSGRNLRVGAFADGLLSARGPLRSLRAFPETLQFLESLPSGGRTALGRAIEGFAPRRRVRGVLIVISDFFQEQDAVAALQRARLAGAELQLIQVLDARDLDPPLSGEVRLVDAEGGPGLDLYAGDELRERLRGGVRAYCDAVAAAGRTRGAAVAQVLAGEDFEEAFFRHLLRPAAAPGPPP
jgi:uncharacterized protein (DUF58 family)